MWKLRYSDKAVRQLAKIDRVQRRAIQKWMLKNVDGCGNPRERGKALTGEMKGYWRYRVGKYRVICELHDGELLVLAVSVGHRDSVYKS